MIDFVLGHLFHTIIINKGGQVTKSIIVVTMCYKLLCHSSRFLISNFLASTDIKVFGRTYLFAILLLFFTPKVFLFSIIITRTPVVLAGIPAIFFKFCLRYLNLLLLIVPTMLQNNKS